MSETIKKHVEKILKTTATVAVVGAAAMGHTVKAEELEETVTIETTDAAGATGEDTAVTIPEAEAQKAFAQTEVDKAQEEKAKADEEVKAADAKVVEAQEAVRQATAERVAATAALEQAKEIAQDLEANPEKPAELEKEIEAKTEEVEKAKATEKEAEENVKAQEEAVKVAKEEATKAEQAVAEAKKQVEDLEGADQAVATLTEEKAAADKTVSDLTTEVETAQSNLVKVASDTETAVAADLADKQKKVQELNNQIDSLSKETKTVTTPTVSADIVGNNTIKVSQAFVDHYNKMNLDYRSASQADQNKLVELGKEVLAQNGVVNFWTNSGYQPTANDNRTVNLDNTKEVENIQTELNLYTAELLNQVRRAFGLNDVVVTESSQLIASAVAAAYASNETYLGSTPGHPYPPHRFDLVTPAGAKYGVTTGQGYENIGSNEIWEGAGYQAGKAAATVGEMKKHIQTQLVMMIFQDQAHKFDHTRTFLTSDNTGTTYLGVGFNGLAWENSAQAKQRSFNQFYEIFNGGQVDASKFNTTPLGGGTQTVKVDNSAKIADLNNQIATLNGEITTLNGYANNIASHPTVQAAQSKVADLNAQLSTAQTQASNLATQLEKAKQDAEASNTQLTAAQAELTKAQSELTTAQTNLSAEEAKLVPLKASLTTAAASVATLEQEVAALENLLALYNNPNLVEEADAALTAALDAEEKVQAQLSEEEKALAVAVSVQAEAAELLATKQAALDEATALLAALIEEYEGLLVERDEEGIHAVLDENLTEEELPVFEIPVDGQVPGGAGASAGADKEVTAGTGAAGAAVVQNLTNKVLTSKATPAVTKAAKTATASLPNTGDKSSLVATVLGSMMMSSAALAGYKRRKED